MTSTCRSALLVTAATALGGCDAGVVSGGGERDGGAAGGAGGSAGTGGSGGSSGGAGGAGGGGAGGAGGGGGGPAGSCAAPVAGATIPSASEWVDTRADVDCEVTEGAAMVYDAGSKLMVLVGGQRDDFMRLRTSRFTWKGSGNWERAGTGVGVAFHGMAYADSAKAIYVFGGVKTASLAPLGETWKSASGSTSFGKLGASGPPARWASPLAYSTATGTIFLFGGQSGASFLDDTWEFDPKTDSWRKLDPKARPPARAGHTLVASSLDGLVYLFGGKAGAPLDDTWAFDPKAGDWCRIDAPGPTARFYQGAAYHAGANAIVIHGGDAGGGKLLPDTWVLDVSKRAWVASPAKASWAGLGVLSRSSQAMAYDPDAGTAIMHGGVASGGGYPSFVPHNTFTFGKAGVSGGTNLACVYAP